MASIHVRVEKLKLAGICFSRVAETTAEMVFGMLLSTLFPSSDSASAVQGAI